MRQWTLLTILAVLVILAGGYFLLVKPKADSAAELRATAAGRRAANAQLEQEIERLKKQALDLPRQQAKLAAFASRIPNNPALPSLIRSLTDAADTAGIELVALSPAPPAALAPAGPAPAAPATAAAPAATTSIYIIPITLSVAGGYVQVQQFFSNIEDLQRTFQVSQFSITPKGADVPGAIPTGVQVAMSGRVFMTLDAPPSIGATTPVQPAQPAQPVQPVPGTTAAPTPAPAQPTASATPAP